MKLRYLALIMTCISAVVLLASCSSDAEPGSQVSADRPTITSSATAKIIITETSSPTLTRVQPVPAHLVLAPGETVAFSAIAFDQEGRELRGATFSWQVIEPEVGTITPGGVFRTGIKTGTFENSLVVTARAPSSARSPSLSGSRLVQATASVTVAEFNTRLQPSDIRVFPRDLELEPGETINLLALAVDVNGVTIPNSKFDWEILQPEAGTVSTDGRLTAGGSLGEFTNALRITLDVEPGEPGEGTSTDVDVRIIDPASIEQRFSAAILPQVVSLRSNETINFTTLVLDRRADPILPQSFRWEVIDSEAGVISEKGRFVAGDKVGTFADAVRVSMRIPGLDEELVASATVLVVEVSPITPVPGQLPRVFIFPERIVLSPGESTRVSIAGVEGGISGSPKTEVRWSVNPPEVGAVSEFVTVTANNFPGVYQDAI